MVDSDTLTAWRQREVQALGAAISNRSWHALETAYNTLRDKMDTIIHQPQPAAAATPPSPTNTEVDALAAKLADADGLDWSEDCGFEQGRDDCNSSTCVAAFYEDHDPDMARGQYRRYARIALRALGITVPVDQSQPSLFDGVTHDGVPG